MGTTRTTNGRLSGLNGTMSVVLSRGLLFSRLWQGRAVALQQGARVYQLLLVGLYGVRESNDVQRSQPTMRQFNLRRNELRSVSNPSLNFRPLLKMGGLPQVPRFQIIFPISATTCSSFKKTP